MLLFIILPFLGAYIGYVYAPEKEAVVDDFADMNSNQDFDKIKPLPDTEEVDSLSVKDLFEEEGEGPHTLGKLEVPKGTGMVTREYFYKRAPEIGITYVYYNEEHPTSDEMSYLVVDRIYPGPRTKTEMKGDLTGKKPIGSDWPKTSPNPDTYVEEKFLTEKNTDLSNFITLGVGCRSYMGGGDCSVKVDANEYGLVPGLLEQTTGPFEWNDAMSLSEIRVMTEGRLFLVWAFGDAGARSFDYSIWDTNNNTHSYVSGYSGLMGEVMSVSAGSEDNVFQVLTTVNYQSGDQESATNIFDANMFGSLSGTLFDDSPDYCVDVNPVSKDRTDPTAPWLLEYSYGCFGYGYDLAFRYYELNPVSGSVNPLSEVLYR